MRAGLGQALGVEAMSLYKHVANKEEVIDGMVERVAAEFQPPPVSAPEAPDAVFERLGRS